MKKDNKENVEKELSLASKLITNVIGTGAIGALMQLGGISPGLQTIVNLGVSVFSGSILTLFSLNDEELLEGKLKTIQSFMDELNEEMKRQNVLDLERLIDIKDLKVEEYNLIEELITEGIKEKSSTTRRLIQLLTIYYTKDKNNTKTENVAETLRLIKQLDEYDIKLLTYYSFYALGTFIEANDVYQDSQERIIKLNQDMEDFRKKLVEDNSLYAQDISISTLRLESLGLIKHKCSLLPEDDRFDELETRSNSNKKELLEEFMILNKEVTEKYKRFIVNLGEIPIGPVSE